MGPHPERTACVRDTGRKKTQCAIYPPQVEEPGVGPHSKTIACVRDTGKKKTGCANCPAQPRVRARRGEEKDTVHDLPGAGARACAAQMQPQTRSANCPPQARAFSLPGKTEAVRGPAPGTSRVRARRGEERDTVRDLPTAGVLTAGVPTAGEKVGNYS